MRLEPWKCPECDQPAKGTLETIPGVALLLFDEEGNAEYAGGNDVCWDGQTTIVDDAGMVTAICPAGHQWQAKTNVDGSCAAEDPGPIHSEKPATGVIEVSGGVVQDVYCSEPKTRVFVIDWDEDHGVYEVADDQGRIQRASVAEFPVHAFDSLSGTMTEKALQVAVPISTHNPREPS